MVFYWKSWVFRRVKGTDLFWNWKVEFKNLKFEIEYPIDIEIMTVITDRFTRILMKPKAKIIKSFCFISKRGKDTEMREMRRNCWQLWWKSSLLKNPADVSEGFLVGNWSLWLTCNYMNPNKKVTVSGARTIRVKAHKGTSFGVVKRCPWFRNLEATSFS